MPIVMTKEEWDRIVRWTDQDKQDPETVRRREYIQYLDRTSQEMTKSWPNSLENVNKRNEEIRRARIEAAEQANTKFYKRYVKRKKEEQERLMFSARDMIFKNKDAPKLLLSAVIETVTQKERAEQVKFNAMLRERAAQRKKKDDDETIRKAREWHELNKQRQKRRFEVNRQHQRDIVEQANEIAERLQKEHEDEVNMQKNDNHKALKEIEALKNFDKEFKAAEKARIWADMEQVRKETEDRRREAAALARMDEQLLQVLQRSRDVIEAKRKLSEKQQREEKLKVLEKISLSLETGDAAREAKELASLEKAIKEKEAAEEARRKAQLEKAERTRRERVESREQFLRDEAQRLHELQALRQWDLINRFKNQEIYEDFKEQKRIERERNIKEYREEILKLWKEREEREAQERAETRHFYGELAEQKIRDADNRVLTHAAALLEEARAHGRPERPLRKAIDQYCKLYRLYPLPALGASLAKHFPHYAPRDGSRPDAAYPPPAQPAGKRHGLQELQPAEQAEPSERKNEPVADYKRAGPANGLQRNLGELDLTLRTQVAPSNNTQDACNPQEPK